MKYAFYSFNENIQSTLNNAAPSVQVIFADVDLPSELPPDCFLIRWLNFGAKSPTTSNNEKEAIIEINIIASDNKLSTALDYAAQIDKAYGFDSGAQYATLNRCDYNDTVLSEMSLYPLESGWVSIEEVSPSVVHLQRTVRLRYAV